MKINALCINLIVIKFLLLQIDVTMYIVKIEQLAYNIYIYILNVYSLFMKMIDHGIENYDIVA